MRLEPEEIAAIKAAAAEAFGPTAVVRLFGSRVDDTLRGGDIDLHVEADKLDSEWEQRQCFRDRVFRVIDPQKIDVVITQRNGAPPRGFERIAYRDGIIL